MESKAGWLCAIAASLLLIGCGRIGVSLLSEELPESDARQDLEPLDASVQQDPLDAELADAGSLDAQAPGLDASQDLDAALEASAPDESGTAPTAPVTPRDAGAAQDGGSAAQDGAAGTDAAVDAAIDAAVVACGGARVLNLCWYLGAENESCQQTCSSRGGYDARTASSVGTEGQGGSSANCAQVLAALGYVGSVASGQRQDNVGLGCHVWDPDAWWIMTMPNLDPTSAAGQARIACACLR